MADARIMVSAALLLLQRAGVSKPWFVLSGALQLGEIVAWGVPFSGEPNPVAIPAEQWAKHRLDLKSGSLEMIGTRRRVRHVYSDVQIAHVDIDKLYPAAQPSAPPPAVNERRGPMSRSQANSDLPTFLKVEREKSAAEGKSFGENEARAAAEKHFGKSITRAYFREQFQAVGGDWRHRGRPRKKSAAEIPPKNPQRNLQN